jgi:hypothetical protein
MAFNGRFRKDNKTFHSFPLHDARLPVGGGGQGGDEAHRQCNIILYCAPYPNLLQDTRGASIEMRVEFRGCGSV